ncbi:8-oxo-dGTP diphosphatase [Candidatus Dependentiae bacterium]|nr:8-oxo-dGTP diphosphatase [Candidatus Dependentiae bacterium]
MKLGVLVYIMRDGKTLMLHRIKKANDCHNGLWVAPGGKVEMNDNESPEDCAVRETFEETGLKINSLKLAGYITFPDVGNSPFGALWYVWIFKTSDFSGNIVDSPEGRLEWIDDGKLLELDMWEGDKIFTPLIYGDRIFNAVMTYDKDKFVSYKIGYL